jgi:hypothetical protein
MRRRAIDLAFNREQRIDALEPPRSESAKYAAAGGSLPPNG